MKIQRLNPLARVPTRATPGDAGADLYSIEEVWLYPGTRLLVDTGIAIELPEGHVGYICPRSGLAWACGITVLNSPGVIDSGYRGSIKVQLINTSKATEHVISVGDRIAQLIIQKVELPEFEAAEELNASVRGQNGHGSSGT
jgi:dUTP pyrophosphatase